MTRSLRLVDLFIVLQPVLEASAVLATTFVSGLFGELDRGPALDGAEAVEHKIRTVALRLLAAEPLLEDFVLEEQRRLHLTQGNVDRPGDLSSLGDLGRLSHVN